MYSQRLFLITSVMYSCFVSSLSVSFDLKSFQFVFVIFLRHLFSKAFSLFSKDVVDFQLSHPYVKTEITHVLISQSFVLMLSFFYLQMFDSELNALDDRAILNIISVLESSFAVILLPK